MNEITEDNFDEYFFDVRKHNPKPDHIMARFRAVGELVEGTDKETIVDLLTTNPIGGKMAVKVLRNACGATDKDGIKVAGEIAKDLLTKSRKEVLEKPYKFVIERFYYTLPGNIPDDPHWQAIKIIHQINKDENGTI